MKKFVVLVDPFSSAAYLVDELQKLGFETIAVLSQENTPEIILSHHTKEKYFKNITFTGDIDSLIHLLQSLTEPVGEIYSVIPGVDSAIELSDLLANRLGLIGNHPNSSSLR